MSDATEDVGTGALVRAKVAIVGVRSELAGEAAAAVESVAPTPGSGPEGGLMPPLFRVI